MFEGTDCETGLSGVGDRVASPLSSSVTPSVPKERISVAGGLW